MRFVSCIIKSQALKLHLSIREFLSEGLVRVLFDKVPVIIGQSTYARGKGFTDDVYGYLSIKTPDNYEEIYISAASGTTFWILKNEQYQHLIEALKIYAEGI